MFKIMFKLFLLTLAMPVHGEVWIEHSQRETSPRQQAHQASTTPVIKTWNSKEFLNPMPQPTELTITTDPQEPSEEQWVSSKVQWTNPDTDFPELDFAEWQVWRAQGLGGFSLRGFVDYDTTAFTDDRVVFASNYKYKVRLVTELGMGPFSEIVAHSTDSEPAGYERPSSNSKASDRYDAMRAKLASTVKRTQSKQETTVPPTVVTVEVEETPEETPAPAAEVVEETPVEEVEEVEEEEVIVAMTAGGDAEDSWSHIARNNDTECSQADSDNGLCSAKKTEDVAQSWYFQSLLSKVLGTTLTQAS